MTVTPDIQKPIDAFVAALTGKLSTKLVSATLYGSAARGVYVAGRSDVNVLLVIACIDAAVLEALRSVLAEHSDNCAIMPYLVDADELARVAEMFPTRILEMKRGYVVLAGKDVLAGVTVAPGPLAVRCRQELLNTLMRTRHRMLRINDDDGLDDDLDGLLASFIKTLRTMLFLATGAHIDPRAEVIAAGVSRYGFRPEVFTKLLAWRNGDLQLDEGELWVTMDGFLEAILKVSHAAGEARETPA